MTARLTFVVALTLVLSACAYSYIPPIPEIRTATPRLRVHGSAGLMRDGETLRFTVTLDEVPQADWLTVQWFAPDNAEAASDAIWVEPGDEGLVFDVYLPADVELTPGRWRAVVSFRGQAIRQFALELPSTGTEALPEPTNDENDDQ